ncbi:MAG: NAD(P)H-dependent flavin oxidoreductase [Gammaproteobacteria bacterium]|jgi:nitronate monooxygenase
MIQTALTQLLGITHPLLAAPMAGVAGGALARAVSGAGGFGLIGGGYGDRNWLAQQTQQLDCSNLGIGFITWRLAENPELLDVALAAQPRAILLSFGDVRPFAGKITASGALLLAQVQSLEAARAGADAGADVIVAQGTEAGGHGGARATLPLVPAIVDAVAPLPVVAAGGIADGRGLAAALMLGASGAMMGTRFYCSSESLAPEAAKSRAVAASGDDTSRTSVFDVLRQYDWPAPYKLRTVANAMTAQFGGRLDDLRRDEAAQVAQFNAAVANDDYAVAAVIAGEALDLVGDVPAAAEIVTQTIREATACLMHPAHFTVQPWRAVPR